MPSYGLQPETTWLYNDAEECSYELGVFSKLKVLGLTPLHVLAPFLISEITLGISPEGRVPQEGWERHASCHRMS